MLFVRIFSSLRLLPILQAISVLIYLGSAPIALAAQGNRSHKTHSVFHHIILTEPMPAGDMAYIIEEDEVTEEDEEADLTSNTDPESNLFLSEIPAQGTQEPERSSNHLENHHWIHQCIPFITAPVSTWISTAITYPLDLTTIRRQTNTLGKFHPYRGFGLASLAVCSTVGINLGIYDTLRAEEWTPAQAGAISGFLAPLMTNPLWVYRVRYSLATDQPNSSLTLKDFMSEFKANPRMGYRGLGISVLNMGTNSIYFELYEFLNSQHRHSHGLHDSNHSFGREMMTAAGARIPVSILTFPLDTVRTIRNKTGQSYPEILKELSSQGVRRFYRGFASNTAKSALSTGIYMELNQILKQILGGHAHGRHEAGKQ